ncbi:nucleoside diphosphate kinase regulator [Mesorhizobium sp. 8]|uniref:nucleoside diphosphate kinase regulator n=1 Tax=Mesorhizobium sp. 8 TaxID=2584466 RepID=UPI00111CE823|nr:nucleoside diphosphate kinase regulator [Mesorhizobium sp. 8]QDC01303.1 nucleoside diphosphate kinase regulator [Mesorhizobium sp. 8]
MQHAIKERPPPKIVVSEADYNRLTGLAEAALERVPAAAGLLAGMDRAVVTTPGRLPADVVRMGSSVTLEGHEGPQQIVLVYPAEADIAAGRISVLTPLGAALIGTRAGQSITWSTRDGRRLAAHIAAVALPSEQERV